MTLNGDFVTNLTLVPTEEILKIIQHEDKPNFSTNWLLKNEIRPIDLYCYLHGRFGLPNGIQNFLRGDHSDNLIHWEWFLRSGEHFLIIQGLNFRTEIWVSGSNILDEAKNEFIEQLKTSFSEFGSEMGKFRKTLEHWIEFVNPYQRLRRSVDCLLRDLSSLGLDPIQDSVPDICYYEDIHTLEEDWNTQAEKYQRAIGLCFGIRSMLPVMAEAFINLLLYSLMKPDLKRDERLRENIIRQPIDIRIRGLANNCFGFKQNIDYSSEICGKYHTLVNERNDLLHGNVVIDKLRFNELYFNGKVPLFKNYLSMWERSLGVAHRSVGLDKVNEELSIVNDLIQYLLSCLDDKIRNNIEFMSNSFSLGLNEADGRLGVLFLGRVSDFSTKR